MSEPGRQSLPDDPGVLERMAQLLADAEDELDLEDAEAALSEAGEPIPFEELEAEFASR